MMARLLLFVLLAIIATGARAGYDGEAGDRRILVMLRLPPEHYRPGSDYGGGYGDAATAAARQRQAARIARDAGLELVEAWPMQILAIDCVIMAVPEGQSLDAAAERVSHMAGVAWSQPIHHFETQAGPAAYNDRLYRAQPAAQRWQLAAIHRVATGKGVTVAVIDSSVDAAHPDLRGRIGTMRDFVGGGGAPEAHGTEVAGIIAARANNAMGIVGVAPDARIMGLRACWQSRTTPRTTCDTLSLAKALTFAIESGADVINLSLSGPRDELLARLVQVGMARGAAVVAAIDPRSGTGFPASVPGVLAVAADGVAGARVGVYNAPGRDIPTTEPGGRWYLVSGNSYAAAHVSGLLALVRQLKPRGAARSLSASHGGGGAVDACDTIRRVAPALGCVAR